MQQLASHDQLKLLRALYRERFDAFAQAAFDIVNPSQKFEWNWHIECLTEHLMAVERGEIKSLIINLPPRNLKSFLVSIAFPAWCFARNAHSQFIVASHSLQPLAEKLSSDTRRLIESDWYKKLFPEVVLDKAMATQLVTNDNGHRLAISAFQSPTGVGADYIILDDINKPDEALSDVIRTGVNGWIDNTAMSRFNDRRTGRFICVQQRVHENDATGHIIAKGGEVVHLVLPIQNRTGRDIVIKLGNKVWTMKDGDYLHKERFTPKVVADIERDLGAYSFAGQYLQTPVPIGGGLLKQEWVKYYNKVNPRTMNVYILCDPANISNDPNLSIARRREKKSDWTAFVVVGLNTDGNKYLLDVVRDKFNPTERIDALFELHRKWSGLAGRPAKVGYEKYGMMTDTHYIQLKMEEENYRFNMIELGGSMSKVDRIGRLIPDLERGNWYFPNKIMYTDTRGLTFDLVSEIIKTEMEMFPVSKHDDCLDALSRIYSEELNATFPRLKKPDLIGSSETENDATDAWVGW